MRKRNISKKKLIIISISAVVLLLALGTISVIYFTNKNKSKSDVKKDISSEGIKSKEERKVSIIDTDSDTRPYAVMINCHNAALPQSGLQDAYIVYELMVEGGITRMLALFKDASFDKLGSVRSARDQYLDYVYENDAIYVHAGGAPETLTRIKNENIDDVDVDGQYGKRDKSLNRAYEHTLFTSSELLNKGTSNKNYRTTTDMKSLLNYSAEELDLSKYDGANPANSVSIKYSDYRTSNYTYDSEKKVYLRSMNDTPNVDLVTHNQYEVKNIIVYGVKYTSYTAHNYPGYQRLDNVGTGEGYYISNGYSIPITWEKNSHNEKTTYKVKATSEELVVNDGNTYIQIYPNSETLSIN